jgi:PAS domain S-box-containing protein
MQIENKSRLSLLHLSYLPAFAGYIATHHLKDFATVQLQFFRELNVPIFKQLAGMQEDELIALTTKSTIEYLHLLSSNQAQLQIDNSIKRWITNQVPEVDKDDIIAEDITTITYARKKALMHFVTDYCKDTEQLVELISEIDFFMFKSETALTNTHINLLKEKINKDAHFIQNVINTSPSAVYVFDVIAFKNIYASTKLENVIGYTEQELNMLGENAITYLIHKDDIPVLQQYREEIKQASDGEIKSYKYRIKKKTGDYRWVRHYESVFKRSANGSVEQLIGVALDIDNEKKTAEKLKKSEQDLLVAQKIGQLGSFSWDLVKQEFMMSPQAELILELEDNTHENFLKRVHAADKENVEAELKKAFEETGIFESIFRYSGKEFEKVIWSRGVVSYEKGQPVCMNGTVFDITERHNILEKLSKSEERYKRAESLTHIGNYEWHLKKNVLQWSEELYRIYGLDPVHDKISFPLIEEFNHPDDVAMVIKETRNAIEAVKPFDFYYRIILKNGSKKTLHARGDLILDRKGKAYKIIGTAQDVTEQHRIQQELKDNQTFIRKITDATPSIITSYNVNTGEYVFISEGLEKLLGYQTKQAIEKGIQFFLEIIHPDDINLLIEKNNTALQEANKDVNKNDIVVEFNYRMRHKNGAYHWFQTYGTIFDRNKKGQVEHVLNISLDVTNQVAAEAKIAEQELFIQQVADASPTILYNFNCIQNCVDYINKEIYFVLGYTVEEVIAMNKDVVKNLYHPEDYSLLPERAESDRTFQHRNSMIQYECRVKSKDGEWKWVLVREVVFKTDNAGSPVQILGAALDITQRKDMERSLLQNSFQLEQSNASLEEFAYVASHDLKEPLRKISTFGDRVLNTQVENMTDEGKVYMNKVVDASQRMQVMINDLLSISMITGDRNFIKYSLQSILEDAKQTLEYKIEQVNAIIDAEALPEANIIPSQFRQLFQNLLSNSLKFIPDGRQPVIKIKSQPLNSEEAAEHQLTKASGYLKLQFSDNGIGFEEEYSGRIFQIFQRLHGRSEYEGTGIGLAICKKIVEHHGGIIYASSELNVGAVFTIIIPE